MRAGAQSCSQTETVIRRASLDTDDHRVREHVNQCSTCELALKINRELGALARTSPTESPKLSADQIYQRALLARRLGLDETSNPRWTYWAPWIPFALAGVVAFSISLLVSLGEFREELEPILGLGFELGPWMAAGTAMVFGLAAMASLILAWDQP